MSGGVDNSSRRAVELVGGAQKNVGVILGKRPDDTDSGGGGGDPMETTVGRTPSSVPPIIIPPGSNNNNHKKQRRLRRHHHHNHNNHHHNNQHHPYNNKNPGNGKRIRRNTQPAPNNTNEFLMKEHDHLFHLDLESGGEDWEGGTALVLGSSGSPSRIYDPDSMMNDRNSSSSSVMHQNSNQTSSFYSSSEDEDYLSRDFSATYDVVHAERLSTMSKSELISEYQLLEERVESLERKLKSVLRSRPQEDHPMLMASGEETANLSEEERVRLVQAEVLRLQDENRRLKADNKILRQHIYIPLQSSRSSPSPKESCTDSGGGSWSGSDTTATAQEELNRVN